MKLNRYETELIAMSNKIISTLIKKGVNPEDAKDIIQDSLLKLLELNGSISFDSIQAWLYRVSFNQYYTDYNRYRTLNDIKEKYLKPELLQVQKEEFDEGNLYQALLSLDEESFNLILLKYIEKLSYKELSIIFNKSEEVLKTECYRIRKKLKKRLLEMEKDDER